VQAEGWAKAAIILGSASALGELRQRRIAALFVRRDGKILTTPLAQWWPTGHAIREQHNNAGQQAS
jgi:hypothetical protein